MKKLVSTLVVLVLALFCFGSSMAANTPTCDISVQLLSQDPYPAIPGDYVKLVFQIGGIADSSCGDVTFQLADKYPISFDPGQENKISFKSGTFVKDYSNHKTIAYKVRVDQDALDGESPIEVLYTKGISPGFESKQFNLSVEDTRADFELYVKNFDFTTNIVTLELLNIAKVNVKSITLEILSAPNLTIKGAKTRIVGDLDSNEYTTTDFELVPADISIPVRIYYTDKAGFRRSVDKSVVLQTDLFQNRKADQKSTPITTYIVIAIVVILLGYWIYKKRKAKSKKSNY